MGLPVRTANPQLKHRAEPLVSMSEPRRILRGSQKKPRQEAGLSLGPSCGLADEGGKPRTETPSHAFGFYVGNPTRRAEKKPRMRAGLSLIDPSLWACRGGGKPAPQRRAASSVARCAEDRTKKPRRSEAELNHEGHRCDNGNKRLTVARSQPSLNPIAPRSAQ